MFDISTEEPDKPTRVSKHLMSDSTSEARLPIRTSSLSNTFVLILNVQRELRLVEGGGGPGPGPGAGLYLSCCSWSFFCWTLVTCCWTMFFWTCSGSPWNCSSSSDCSQRSSFSAVSLSLASRGQKASRNRPGHPTPQSSAHPGPTCGGGFLPSACLRALSRAFMAWKVSCTLTT